MVAGISAGTVERSSQEEKKPAVHPLFPYESRYLFISGFRMHYVDEGSGPCVLLLHGNPTWSFYYRRLIENLKEHFRVIAPDFIGLGLSDHPQDIKFRAEDRIKHLQEFVDKLELNSFSLVMHDWGGSLGTGLAVRNPERIERIVYLNTTLTETEALPAIIKMAATPYIGKILTKYTKRFLKFTTQLGVSRKLSKEVKSGYYLPYKNSTARSAIWNFVDDIPFDSSHPTYALMMELAEQIEKLRDKQVQIVWGLRDPCFHREMLNKVARFFPQAEVLEISEASHLVLEDAPDTAIPAISNFLRLGPGQLARTEKPAVNGDANALYSSFQRWVESHPRSPAVIEPLFLPDMVRYGQASFQDLASRINKYQRGLLELGMRVGDRVLMLVPPGIDFLALSYAVMGRGAIPIFVDPGIGKEALFACVKHINPDVLIGSARAQLLRLKRAEIMPNLRFYLTVSDWIWTGGPNLNYLKRFSSKPLPAESASSASLIAFTSGATGAPKGVVFTNDMLREQLRIFREVFGIAEQKRDLPLLPIFSLFQLANGVCSVIPPIDPSRPLSLSAERVLKVVHDLGVSYSFGSPTLWNKIAEYCVRSGEDLGQIEKIFMAGAPVSESVLERVKEVLPDGEVFTPYGATEALPVSLVSATEIKGKKLRPADGGELGTYVGQSIDGVSIKVIPPHEGKLESFSECGSFEIGEVIVSGKNVSPEYFENPEANELGKIHLRDDTIWHRMGDVGYLDDEGHLYYCGRKAHAVKAPSRTYYSIPVERIFNEHPKVKRSALVSLGENAEPGVVIEPFPQHFPDGEPARSEFLKEIEALAAENELTNKIQWFFLHPSFPVDARHNAKIFRDKLSAWARPFTERSTTAA